MDGLLVIVDLCRACTCPKPQDRAIMHLLVQCHWELWHKKIASPQGRKVESSYLRYESKEKIAHGFGFLPYLRSVSLQQKVQTNLNGPQARFNNSGHAMPFEALSHKYSDTAHSDQDKSKFGEMATPKQSSSYHNMTCSLSLVPDFGTTKVFPCR